MKVDGLLEQVLAKQLKEESGHESVYVSPGQTTEEQKAHKELVKKLKQLRGSHQNSSCVIKNVVIIKST